MDRCERSTKCRNAVLGYGGWRKVGPPEFNCRKDEAKNLPLLRIGDVVVDRRDVRAVRKRQLFRAQEQPDLAVLQQSCLCRLQRIVAMTNPFDLATLQG